ncbi:DUF4274 domain-containing protein [Streptococcus suis]|nr:DUF4274 domain-containing protein [Streptococcus suis]MBM7179292.1 DUF4274 domain-containing protein [Streptococcus suis]MCQ9224081.1 DUF4274 domain-containing protein [Streptococcus suis]MCQ9230728.1 DUF4274 domain-containing protein [Streptococcus suis]NQH32570.1 DUF4274 domain-containing protein [Streptococcus suis]NQH74033.1 DUF4274 domain-containing protein [Streptococcus suis]
MMEAIEIVKNLLETEDLDMLSKIISDVSSEEILYLFVCNFNYDSNIDKLYYIINHSLCSRNIALKIFYLLDGYSFLLGDLDNFSDQSVPLLLDRIYTGLVSNDFSKGNIEIQSEFTKVQIYKLKKLDFNIPTDILFGIEGNFIDSTL